MSHDVTILGAGIVGICSALSLLEQGKTVRLIDRAAPGQGGASFGNAGVVSPWSVVPQSTPGLWKSVPHWLLRADGPLRVRLSHLLRFTPWGLRFLSDGREARVREISPAMHTLNHANIDLYRYHLSGTGAEDLIADSWYVYAYEDASGLNIDSLGNRLKRDRGAELEMVDGNGLREVEPDLSPHYQAALLIKGQARILSPGRLCTVLAEKARKLGAEITRAEIRGLTPGADWTVHTDQGDFSSSRLLIAAGPWSARLLEPLGVKVPLEAERGYHMEFRNPGVSLRNSVMDAKGHFVTSSMEHALRSAGTAEFGGLDAPPDMRRARLLIDQTKRMLPGLNTEDVHEWSGIRPSFPDSLPALGSVPGHEGLFAAFGHSHWGLMMAPATGRIAADLVAGRVPNEDISPYRLDRF